MPANTKSIFRFSEPVEYFVKKLAESVPAVADSLNQIEYRPDIVQLKNEEVFGRTIETIPVDPKAIVQEFSPNLKIPNLLRLLAASKLTCVFPPGFDRLSFGLKRVEREGEKGVFDFEIQFGQAIPETEDWKIIDKFLSDQLVQRVLIRLTRQSTSAAEINIGIKNGKVDIRNVNGSSIKNTELKQFAEKYQQLAN